MDITQDLVKKLFDYKDGHLYWKVRKSNSVKIGDKVGSINSDGYVLTNISGIRCKVHRLIWIFHYGDIKNLLMDHIDGNRSNNKIAKRFF